MNIVGDWFGDIAVTEKLDGVASSFVIGDGFVTGNKDGEGEDLFVEAITGPKEFFTWVNLNAGDLVDCLADGIYHGVWWGKGLGRGYGVPEQRFALFALDLYDVNDVTSLDNMVDGMSHVPVLYWGPLKRENDQDPIMDSIRRLQFAGSAAAPGFKPPAGVVVTNLSAGVSFSVDL